MPLADPGPEWSTEQVRQVGGECGTCVAILPLFSLTDDALEVRTGPGSFSPCDCIGQWDEVGEIRRLIAMVRATLARTGKGH
jgi:hypothetical protein